MLQKCGIRGSVTEDEWHRIINDLGDAAKEAGVWTLILEWGAVSNFRAGPWKGASFLQKLKTCSEAYYRDQSPADELFKTLYDRIAGDFNMTGDLDYGSADHMAKVWQRCSTHKVWQTNGMKMKMGRWTTWYMSQEQLKDGRHTLLLSLILVGSDQGWRASLARSPLFKVMPLGDIAEAARAEDPLAPGAAVPPPVVAEEPERQSVAASNNELRKARSACQNQMHFAALVLANPFGGQLVNILCTASSALRRDFWTGIERSMTKVGAFLRDVDCVMGKGMDILAETVRIWSDRKTLLELGFIDAGALIDDEDELMEAERRLCAHWSVWLRKIIVNRHGSLGTWTLAYPHRFLGLVADDLETQRATLGCVKADFDLLTRMEEIAHHDNYTQEILHQLMWPRCVFTRETFIDLVECGWALPLASSVSERLKGFAFVNKRTKIQEDLFNRCRKRESLSDASFCSRRGRWDVAVRSSLITDYDRKNLFVSPQAKDVACRTLGAAMLENKAAAKFSMGEDTLMTIQEVNPSWPTPSPASYKLRADAWLCCRALAGDMAKVRQSWLSLLSPPGFLLQHPDHLPRGVFGLASYLFDSTV